MNYSAVIERLIQQAKDSGLEVTVLVDKDEVLQSVSVDMRRPIVADPTNMLEVVQNGESIRLHSVRCFNEGRWTNHASYWGYRSMKGQWMSLRSVQYRIESMAR